MKKIAMVMVLVMTVAVAAFAASNDWQQNYGKVGRLYPANNGYYFTLVGGMTAMNPADGYYFVHINSPNYDKLVELLFHSASYGWTINAKTQAALDAGKHAVIEYFVVDVIKK